MGAGAGAGMEAASRDLRLGLEVDGDGVDDGRRGIGGGARGRQLQGDVVPALARALHDIGAARQLEQRRRRLRAGGEARVIVRRPAGVAHLIAHRHVGIERRTGNDVDFHLGLLGARRRQGGELLFELLDAAVEVALLHLGVERQALRLGHAAGDERQDLLPVGVRNRLSVGAGCPSSCSGRPGICARFCSSVFCVCAASSCP